MRSIEASGKTVEEALKNGLTQLGCDLSQVTHEVIDRGSPGLFGMFGRLAKVKITVNEPEPVPDIDFELPELKLSPEKPAKDAAKKDKKEKKEPRPDKAKRSAPSEAEKPARANAEPVKEAKAETAEDGHADTEAPQTEAAKDGAAPKSGKSRRSRSRKEKPAQSEQTAENEEVKDIPVQPAREFPELDVNALSEDGKKAYEFLSNITRLMDVDVDIRMIEEENQILVDINGDTLGVLIGRRGETLDAIQYLTSLTVNRDKPEYTRVTIDVEHYRAKREETLRKLAARMAARARKSGRRVVLEPMNPYERRVLHSALQDNPYVQTHSEGEEPYRRVIITLK